MGFDETKTKHTGVYLSNSIYSAVKSLASEEGRSFTKQVERILQDWLIENGHLKKDKKAK